MYTKCKIHTYYSLQFQVPKNRTNSKFFKGKPTSRSVSKYTSKFALIIVFMNNRFKDILVKQCPENKEFITYLSYKSYKLKERAHVLKCNPCAVIAKWCHEIFSLQGKKYGLVNELSDSCCFLVNFSKSVSWRVRWQTVRLYRGY